MNHIKQSLKLKLLALFLISNMCSFMIGIDIVETDSDMSSFATQENIHRDGYSDIIIAANLKTEINDAKPVALIHEKSRLYIPYVFIIKKINLSEEDKLSFENLQTTQKYLIQVKDEYIKSILKYKNFNIVPQLNKQMLFNSSKGANYEINI